MTRLSFWPVECVIDSERSTSSVRFTPSGVNSNAQANRQTNGKPSNNIAASVLPTHVGVSNISKSTSPTCSTTHPITM